MKEGEISERRRRDRRAQSGGIYLSCSTRPGAKKTKEMILLTRVEWRKGAVERRSTKEDEAERQMP